MSAPPQAVELANQLRNFIQTGHIYTDDIGEHMQGLIDRVADPILPTTVSIARSRRNRGSAETPHTFLSD
jgi:hypothetical protein